jgi:hypothetical protein
VAIDVARLAARVARAISQHPPEQWTVLERVYVDRLLDHLEEQHQPAEVDAAVDRFVEVLHLRLAGDLVRSLEPARLTTCPSRKCVAHQL